jgi:hypothetical protein
MQNAQRVSKKKKKWPDAPNFYPRLIKPRMQMSVV